MAKEIKTKQGYTVLKVSIDDIVSWGGIGICDSCNTTMMQGYLIYVLNACYCGECFSRWDSEAKFYKEDLAVEQRIKSFYSKYVKLESEENEQ
jgi:hypothetical protein